MTRQKANLISPSCGWLETDSTRRSLLKALVVAMADEHVQRVLALAMQDAVRASSVGFSNLIL